MSFETKWSVWRPRTLAFVGVLLIALLVPFTESEARILARPLVCDYIVVFVSDTCPHCAAAREFLADLVQGVQRLRIAYREVTGDQDARADFLALNERHGIARPGLPTFDVCGRIIIGFDANAVLDALYGAGEPDGATSVEVPLFGDISPVSLGLPAFTLVLGLIDGFNPCAMWILLFLLSILVNVKRRSRILLVAGTFVAVSGITYFAFMAAWLNAFLIIGYSRVIQLVLGGLAVLIGSVHLKDFFALHRGFSLSIPDSVKPKLYDRIRRVVRAENLLVALGGTVVLAMLVNFVELLCTAGLPALYTQILSYYDLEDTTYYGYLMLYNLAYIADDALMVTIALVTLGHRRLQEREARWLKLVSGGLIVALGAVLILAPQVLAW